METEIQGNLTRVLGSWAFRLGKYGFSAWNARGPLGVDPRLNARWSVTSDACLVPWRLAC